MPRTMQPPTWTRRATSSTGEPARESPVRTTTPTIDQGDDTATGGDATANGGNGGNADTGNKQKFNGDAGALSLGGGGGNEYLIDCKKGGRGGDDNRG